MDHMILKCVQMYNCIVFMYIFGPSINCHLTPHPRVKWVRIGGKLKKKRKDPLATESQVLVVK